MLFSAWSSPAAPSLIYTLNERIISPTANSRRGYLVLRGVMAHMDSRDATLAQPTQQHFGFDNCHAPEPDDIRAARTAAGLTQTEAGAVVHASLRTWQQWEAGDRKMHPDCLSYSRSRPHEKIASNKPATETTRSNFGRVMMAAQMDTVISSNLPGIEVHGKSIRVVFMHKGVRHRHTLGIEPTKANLKHASRLRSAAMYALKTGPTTRLSFSPIRGKATKPARQANVSAICTNGTCRSRPWTSLPKHRIATR